MNWVKVGTDVAVGGGAGALGEFVSEKDKPDVNWYKQPSTYYNYGFPIVAILLAAFGLVRGDWETRLITAGATMGGGQVYRQAKSAAPAGYSWTQQGEARRKTAEVARQRALAQARQGAETSEGGLPLHIEEEEILA